MNRRKAESRSASLEPKVAARGATFRVYPLEADVDETQRIADSYRAATIKGAWYGPTLAELLAGISPELATTPPVHPLAPKPRPAGREDSEFSRSGFGETGSRAQLSLRNDAPWNRAPRDLPFGADRNGPEHAAVAIA
jgi:hypothetical protein